MSEDGTKLHMQSEDRHLDQEDNEDVRVMVRFDRCFTPQLVEQQTCNRELCVHGIRKRRTNDRKVREK